LHEHGKSEKKKKDAEFVSGRMFVEETQKRREKRHRELSETFIIKENETREKGEQSN